MNPFSTVYEDDKYYFVHYRRSSKMSLFLNP